MLELHNPMPLYWFHIDSPEQPQVLAKRIRSIVREEPGWRGIFRRIWRRDEPSGPPFIGSVGDASFKLRRDIRGRNSFLPLVWGHIIPTETGARVNVTMYIHPVVALFMVFWLGSTGSGALTDTSAFHLILWGMFVFGVALTTGGFFPEALKAQRLLTITILKSEENAVSNRWSAKVSGNSDNS